MNFAPGIEIILLNKSLTVRRFVVGVTQLIVITVFFPPKVSLILFVLVFWGHMFYLHKFTMSNILTSIDRNFALVDETMNCTFHCFALACLV